MVKAPTFILGAQYFRPPFPHARHWDDDIRAMRDAGLNAVQLWLVWGWCEPEPGKYVFDDYDRIADLAGQEGLGLVLSTLPEINPFWVPRVHPDGLMVDIEGRRVLNCNRWECISGIVPGACSDNPIIRGRMADFLTACGRHFGPRQNLLAWDCWNENRWRNMAPEIVCFCDHSLAAQRRFLAERYGSLGKLAAAWGRRLCDWDDVRFGRLYGYSYPEMHDFTAWMCRRAEEMIGWRGKALREADPAHVVSSHTGNPTIFGGVNLNENLFSRGVDWDIAVAGGYGYSSFPNTPQGRTSPVDFCVRASSVITAPRAGRPVWMSEMQGGACTTAGRYGAAPSGAEQQAWVWTGFSRGAKAAIFWCWRDEIFGVETNGYGLAGGDGLAPDRIAHLRCASAVLAEHGDAIAAYTPDAPEVALLFQRDGYFYGWMDQQKMGGNNEAVDNLLAYARALERQNVPYAFYDDRHLPPLFGSLKLVIVPDPCGLDDAAVDWLARFARQGGAVFVEAAAGMHGPDTFFRYPGERPLYRKLRLPEILQRGATRERRTIPAGALGNETPIEITLGRTECTYDASRRGVIGLEPDGLPMLAEITVGKGRAIALGAVLGAAMDKEHASGLDALTNALVARAGVRSPVTVESDGSGFCTARLGRGSTGRLLIVTNFAGPQSVTLHLDGRTLPKNAAPREWFGHELDVDRARGVALSLTMNEYDYAVIAW